MFQTFQYNHSLTLESGFTLPGFHLSYTVYGKLNKAKDNVVWVFHALTANSDPAEWWPGLVGDNQLFNPLEYFIICVNMPGSCYGSIGPLDHHPATGEIFYHDFPFFTTRDMIRAYQQLQYHLGIEKIKIGIGGSMGGQQLIEWAVADVFFKAQGDAYLGLQGDIWDAQKDIALAFFGAIIATTIVSIVKKSLKVK